MSKQCCFGDDLGEGMLFGYWFIGINHTTIALTDSTTRRLFMTGIVVDYIVR